MSTSAKVGPGQRFTTAHQCPVCGGHDARDRGQGTRCYGFLSDDGNWAHCTRGEHAGDLQQKEGSGTYPHRLEGECACGVRHGEPMPAPNIERNDYRKKPQAKPTDVWPVKNQNGGTQAVHVRFDHGPHDKDCLWRLPGAGPRDWGLKGLKVTELPLYRSEHATEWPEDLPIVVVEGERAADALAQAYEPVLGTVTGASGTPGLEALEVLKGKRAILWADNDEEGRRHMERLAGRLRRVALEMRIFQWAEAPPKGDAADHPAVISRSREGIAQLLSAMAATPVLEPEPKGHAEKNGPETFTAPDLMALELPPMRWAVPGVVPEGVTLLAGKPKVGKSWFTLGHGVATAAGGVALGTKPVEQGEVLYLALEDDRRRLQGRLAKILAGGDAPIGLHIALEWLRLDEGGAEALDTWLEAHREARLVVIDTLKKVRSRKFGNRSVYDVDYEALEPLLPLAAEHNVAVVVVHHTRKLAAADPLDEISGSTGLSGGVDGALVLKRDRGRADAYLYVMGRDIEEEQELALRWDANTAGWCIVGDAEEYRLSEERQAVARVLRNTDGPLGPKDVAEALDKPNGAVRELLSQMAKSSDVENVSYGKYTVKSPDTADGADTFEPVSEASVRGSGTAPDALGNENAANDRGVSGVRSVSVPFDPTEYPPTKKEMWTDPDKEAFFFGGTA